MRFDEETADALALARETMPAEVPGERVVFGFDGYVDRVRELVADREDPETHDRLDTLAAFGDRVTDSVAADSSLSFEWLQRGRRTGGHTCHLARAFGTWGFDPAMVGMYGDPPLDVFEREFGEYDLHTLGKPGYTDAVEFDDGKLMLSENGDTIHLDWERLLDGIGWERLAERLDGAALLGMGYWAETPDLPSVLDGLAERWSEIPDPPGTVLVDPGDVRKLDADRLRAGRDAVARLDAVADVVVSANRAETDLLADTYGVAADGPGERARRLRETLGTSLFVSHGVERSVVASAAGATGVAVPAVDDPALTTSAGDHFNAGLALALLSGMAPAAAVLLGNAVAGAFVRSGEPPTLAAVRAFVDDYEAKF